MEYRQGGHLISIAVGPVQSFIAAARRTRDLWFGSYLLSEISKAAAKYLHDSGSELIFPSPQSPKDLDKDSAFGGANKILAVTGSGANPETVFAETKKACLDRWRELADEVYQRSASAVDKDLFTSQVEDALVVYGAWVRCSGDYSRDRDLVERLLRNRKELRDFGPAEGRQGVPKSSLDGARESVLLNTDIAQAFRQRSKIKKGEHLDAVGLIKRVGGGTRPYPSVADIACSPWLRKIESSGAANSMETLEIISSTSRRKGFGTRLRGIRTELVDGTFCYRSRMEDVKADNDLSDEEIKSVDNALRDLGKDYGNPTPYMAILIADGDHMGRTITSITTLEGHREFSRALSHFAGEVEGIVAENLGSLVYSGGDDVVAFLPVDKALKAARDLHDRFSQIMGECVSPAPTLSVGLGVCHFMEPMADILKAGRRAEVLAKEPDRDGLAVSIVKRATGVSRDVRGRFGDRPDDLIQMWMNHLKEGRVSARAAFHLEEIANFYDEWPEETEGLEKLIKMDVERMLKKKRSDFGSIPREMVDCILQHSSTASSLKKQSDIIICARYLAALEVD